MTVQEAYNYSVYFLGANGVDEEEFKAKCLVCHLAKIANRDYHSHLGDLVSQKKLADGLWQLKSGTPLQYVLGEWDFLDSTFAVGPGVLIPRPETEELAQLAIEQVKNAGPTPVVWDLCAGSGCIGIAIAKPVPVPASTVWKSRQMPLLICKRTPCLLPMCALYWQISAAI